LVPWYIVGFLMLVGLRSVDLVRHETMAPVAIVPELLKVISMAALGLGTAVVHLKPRMSRLSHFHDRVVTAILDGDDSGVTSFRWDITSCIDNLMERDRQCSVFLTKKAISSPIATSEVRENP
jgi:hypothetical protein